MTLRYVALGDSYTIGTGLPPGSGWPERLVAALGDGPDGTPRLHLAGNLAANGRTSRDVLRDQLRRLASLAPAFVSLLIGVNDVVQWVPPERYREHLSAILGELAARLPAARIVTVTTPDYTVTPVGGSYGDPATQRAGIVRHNATLAELAAAHRIAVVDIFDLSQRAAAEPAMVARDGLHPSGRQYDLWVERIAPVVRRLLG